MGRLIVSDAEGLRETACGRRVPLPGAGALCAAEGAVFCAGEGSMIWRLDDRTLMPQGLFAGGPGMGQLLAQRTRLYALCADADGVLLLSAQSGAPQVFARAGVGPTGMAMADDVLAVAGGMQGSVLLLDRRTLEARGEIAMPGPVMAAALGEGAVYALCLTETLESLLVRARAGTRQSVHLPGMPGALCLHRDQLLAATQGFLYVVDARSLHVRRAQSAPGRADRLEQAGKALLMHDVLREQLYRMERGRIHNMGAAVGFCVCGGGESAILSKTAGSGDGCEARI